jgi:hypothetical protein
MSAGRVILITVAGPSGHVDVGVRSDATPADLADALGRVIGVGHVIGVGPVVGAGRSGTVIEHRSPPRPGVPDGRRVSIRPETALAEAGVADGDLVLFRTAEGGAGASWPEAPARPAELGAGAPALSAPALSAPAPPGAPDGWTRQRGGDDG